MYLKTSHSQLDRHKKRLNFSIATAQEVSTCKFSMRHTTSGFSSAEYRPFPLRSGYVAMVILFTIILIVLMEISCRLLPTEGDQSAVSSTALKTMIGARNAGSVYAERTATERHYHPTQQRKHGAESAMSLSPTPYRQESHGSFSRVRTRGKDVLLARTTAVVHLQPATTMTTTKYDSRTHVTIHNCTLTETEYLSSVTIFSYFEDVVTEYASTVTAIVLVSSATIYVTEIQTFQAYGKVESTTTSSFATTTQYVDYTTTEYLPAETTTVHVISVSMLTTTTVVYVLQATTSSISSKSRNIIAKRSYGRHNNSAVVTAAETTAQAEPEDELGPDEDSLSWITQYEPLETITKRSCSSTVTTTEPVTELLDFGITTSTEVIPFTTTTVPIYLYSVNDALGSPVISSVTAQVTTITSTTTETIGHVGQTVGFFSLGTTTVTRYTTISVPPPPMSTKPDGYLSVGSTTITQFVTVDLLPAWTTITEISLLYTYP